MSVENTSTKAQLGSSSADIVERLREFAAYGGDAKARILAQLALTEIERLRGGAARARDSYRSDVEIALREIRRHCDGNMGPSRASVLTRIANIADAALELSGDAAQSKQERSDLTKLAAECHRAKWEFDLSEDFQPSKSAARALITNAFNALHRIGDMALKLRDAASSISSTENTAPMTSQQGNTP